MYNPLGPSSSGYPGGNYGNVRRPPVNPMHVILVGQTGTGKSYLANKIVGYNAFETGENGVTYDCEYAASRDGMWNVYDTIGMGGGIIPHDEAVQRIRRFINGVKHVSFDCILYVTKQGRLTVADQRICDIIKNIFESNYICLVVNNTSEDWVIDNIYQLINTYQLVHMIGAPTNVSCSYIRKDIIELLQMGH